MHVGDGVDAGVAHRRLNGLCRLLNLRVPADLLRQEVAGMRDADAESLLADALEVGASREHGDVRGQHSLGAAGHDERYSGLDLTRSELEMGRKSVTQCGDGVFAREVIDPAIAFGLAQHRENGRRLERAAVDKSHEAGHISWPVGRNAYHVE